MPKERRKRGRRQESKRKVAGEQNEGHEPPIKRSTPFDEYEGYEYQSGQTDEVNQGMFFGLLDDQELAYFASLDTLITSNQFDANDDKDVFIDNTFAEIQGRELKIATSPASRFLEKLIFLLRRDQLLAISRILISHFLDLIHRPSASFCCEALILKLGQESATGTTPTEIDSPLELLQSIGNQIASRVTDIMSHPFASHVLRVFLLILTSSFLDYESKISFLQNKQKEGDEVHQKAITILKDISTSSPAAFQKPLHALITKLGNDLDSPTAQNMAVSPIASPALQIVIEYELNNRKKQASHSNISLLSCLVPNEDVEGENLIFLQTLIGDPIGSHLMEIVVTKSPGRIFKRIHRSLFDGKLLSIARDKSAATYVLVKALERFSSGNLEKAVLELASGLRELVQDANTSVITSLIVQCRRRNVDVRPISEALEKEYGRRFVEIVSQGSQKDESPEDVSVHVSVMMQTMLAASDELREFMIDGMEVLSQDQVVSLSKQRAASRVVQAALAMEQPLTLRKQLVAKFLGKVAELGQHNIASHVIDALWAGCTGLNFLRDQLIHEVLANEHILHQTIAGRAVCRNWRKWSREIEYTERPMKGIDKARKRHAMAAFDNRKKPRLD